jgi:hypothetical protein
MELKVLTASNLKLILKNKIVWAYIILFGLFVLGSKQRIEVYRGTPDMVAMNYNIYMVYSFFILPFLMGVMFNDKVCRFLPSVILSKLEDENNHFISQFLAYICIVMGTFILANLKLFFSSKIYNGNFLWIFFIKYFLIYGLTLFYYIPLIMLIWSFSKKFTIMIIGTFLFLLLQIVIKNPYFSVLFTSDTFQSILIQSNIVFWISRAAFAGIGIFILIHMHKIYNKKDIYGRSL